MLRRKIRSTGKSSRPFRAGPFSAVLSAQGIGCLAGIPAARKAAEVLGLRASWEKQNGEAVGIGEEIAHFQGTPEQIVKIENLVIGLVSQTFRNRLGRETGP